jgi:hypothetical protein
MVSMHHHDGGEMSKDPVSWGFATWCITTKRLLAAFSPFVPLKQIGVLL